MQKQWKLLAVLTLVAWAVYVVFGVRILSAPQSLGGGAVFLLAVVVCAVLLLRPSDYEIEATSAMLVCAGFVMLNHLLTMLGGHPLDWTAPALIALVGLPFALVLIPALSVNYWFMKKPRYEPGLAGVLWSVLLAQVFPLFGLLVVLAFTPTLTAASPSDLASRLMALQFCGIAGGCLVACWELRRRTPSEMRAVFVPTFLRRSSAPDRPCWLVVAACLGVGTAFEASRGEWIVWVAQGAGVLGLYCLVWRIYRWRYVPPEDIVEQLVSSQAARPSIVRVALLLWVLITVCAILAAAIRRFT